MSSGVVVSLNISPGGVPKRPVDSVRLGVDGFEGDGHDDVKNHGGLDRAVCIFATELIEALRREGHPIFPGSAGENVTVSGLDWSEMVPGVEIGMGDAVVRLTAYTTPCRTIRGSFIDGYFGRISQKANPGWSRVYGKVLAAGLVRVGDTVEITGPSLA